MTLSDLSLVFPENGLYLSFFSRWHNEMQEIDIGYKRKNTKQIAEN